MTRGCGRCEGREEWGKKEEEWGKRREGESHTFKFCQLESSAFRDAQTPPNTFIFVLATGACPAARHAICAKLLAWSHILPS